MLLLPDPDRTVSTMSHTRCAFHVRHPGEAFAGCTCSLSVGYRDATEEEYRQRRQERLTKERGRLRDKLAATEAALASLTTRTP